MLKDDQCPAWAGNPAQFAEPELMLIMRDMMKHAGREAQVEIAVGQVDAGAFDDHDLALRARESRGRDLQRSL